MKKSHKLALATASLAIGFGVMENRPAHAVTLSVDAAASLTNALPVVEALYQQSNPDVSFTNTFGASGTLLNQIQNGATADIFFPVSEAPLDTLQAANQLLPGTRQDLLTNSLAIITASNSTLPISSVQDLTSPQVQQVAIGNPSFVPAGQYAQQLFNTYGLSSQLQPKLVLGSSVRDTLNLVANNQADAGVVYNTDALSSNLVKVVNIPPTSAYSRIVYASAVLQSTQNPNEATSFNSFLGSSQALSVFQGFGFTSAKAATPVPEPLTVGGSAVAGVFGILMKRKIAAKAKAKSKVAVD